VRRAGLTVAARLLGLLLLVAIGWQAWRVRSYPLPDLGKSAPGGLEVRGVLHVHTLRSDGAGSPEDVAAAARRTGCDFVVLTDHDGFDALGGDRYANGVLVLEGIEISTDGGHVVALDLPNPDFRFDGDPRSVLDDVRGLGGFSIASHPFSSKRERQWRDAGADGFDALEIFNWAEDGSPLALSAVAAGLSAIVRARYGLLRATQPFERSLEFWDALTAKRRIVGLAAADAHGGLRIRGNLFIPFPKYEHAFELFRTHVLLDEPLSGDARADRSRVMNALREGRSFFALDGLALSDGFRFLAARSKADWPLGASVPLSPELRLEVQVPKGPTETVLLRAGDVVARASGETLSFTPTEKGAYRVEVYWRAPDSPVDRSVPWIVSNPIYIDLEENAPPPHESTAVPEDSVLWEDFETGLADGWRTAADSASRVSAPATDSGGGAEGSSASVVFDFRMGGNESEASRSHVALEFPPPADLARARGISFWVRTTGTYRFDLQARDRKRDGIEPWRKSVKTSPEWREVFISWDELKSYNRQSDGRFDAGEAQGLAVYLDTATVRAGTVGRIWLDRFRLHLR